MIQQRAEELVALIGRQRTLGSHLQQLEGFGAQRQEVERASGRLGPLVAAWRLFLARGIGKVAHPPDAPVLLEQLRQLRDRYLENASSILGPNRLVAVKTTLPSIASSLERELLTAWDTYTRERIPAVNDEVLNVLGRIPALRAHVDRVWAGLRALKERQLRLPTTQGEIDTFDRMASDAGTTWNAFDSAQLPSEVLRFLKEAGSGGAALETLTEVVRRWLDQHALTASFRIRSISSGPTGS